MKRILITSIVLLFASSFLIAQTPCVVCDDSYAIPGASTIGTNNNAQGGRSIILGSFSQTLSTGNFSIAIGSRVKAMAGKCVAIGSGISSDYMFSNYMQESLMVGFNSNLSTFFVSMSEGLNRTGRVAIGNVVNQYGQMEPLAKLHLRSDEGEAAAIYVQPYNWLGGEVAGIYLGNFLNGMKADTNMGITFLSEKDYVFGVGNVGLGVEQPKAKLHIDGNILFENPADGFIMKSESGQCWKVTINNDGSFNSTMVDCENFSGTQNNKEDQHTPLYFYPNPTSGLLKIDNRSNTNGWVVEFRSLSGTLLKSDNLASGTNQFDLNFAADGMLIVSVYDQQGNMVTSEKIVVK